MPIAQDNRPLITRVHEFAKKQNGTLMFAVAGEIKRYGHQIGNEEIISAAARIPMDSIISREAPLVSAYADIPEEVFETLASERHSKWITVSDHRNQFNPEVVVIRPEPLIGTVLGTLASVAESNSWVHRAMYIAALLVALRTYLKGTAAKLSPEEGQVILVIYLLGKSNSSRTVSVNSVLSTLNQELANNKLPAVTAPVLNSHIFNLIALGILRLDPEAEVVSLQEKVIEL